MQYNDELYGTVEITEPLLVDLMAGDAVQRTKGIAPAPGNIARQSGTGAECSAWCIPPLHDHSPLSSAQSLSCSSTVSVDRPNSVIS